MVDADDWVEENKLPFALSLGGRFAIV